METPIAPTPLEKILDEAPEHSSVHRNASWGATISILVILAMIIIGALYSWGKRVADEHHLPDNTLASTTTY